MRSYAYTVEHDLTGRDALKLAERLAEVPLQKVDALILSLANVNVIDASGLAVLVRLYSHLSRAHKHLVLRDFHDDVERLLRQVGLEDVLVDAQEPSALGDPARHRPWTPADSRLPSRRNAEAGATTIDDLVHALAQLESEQAVVLLEQVKQRLGLHSRLGERPRPEADEAPAVTGPTSPETPGPESADRGFDREDESHKFSVVQGEILRTGKRRALSFSHNPIVNPDRVRTVSDTFTDDAESIPPLAPDPVPQDGLPNDVETLLLEYLGDPSKLVAPAAQSAEPAHDDSDRKRLSLVNIEPPVSEPANTTSSKGTRRKPLPPGIEALLSDYLSHDDASTLGPWASASSFR